MSNRDSMGFGDLLPQDVVEVFAQERQSKRGRKKRSNSLGRALGWLKGKKRKDLGANGQSLGLGPALDLALDGHPAGYQGGHKGGQKSGKQNHPYGNSHAVPKRNDGDKAVAPPLLQENVFIETSRPKYLEDLHSEALEGLKLMQQEENNSGVEFRDNESTISTMTAQTDGESGGFITDSTIADTTSVVSVQSSVSTRSSRSGLTRQGSTFRPLNSGKKVKRGRHRKTVGGIPQHVRREMGLDRVDWTLTERFDKEQLYNGETDTSTTSDGSEQTPGSPETSVDLPDMKIIQPLNKAQTERLGGSHAGHRDDLALLSHHLGPGVSDEPRPRSLAVPSMTTANGEQPGPVMSMSPQAAYMSKIIPNAVLLPSIEVLEISRGRSRNSVRTVGKGGLLLSSPASSRASSRASSSRTTSSRASTITSASRYNPPHLSDSSCWTTSESSDTLVSDSSTISSSTTPRQKRSHDGDASAKEDGVSVHSSISKASKCTSNGRVLGKVDEAKRDGQFVRSLSVMKPKRAPPPPSRSYSLHNKMKRRSRDLRDIRIVSGESSPKKMPCEENKDKSQYSTVDKIDSPSYHADTSSLDDSMGSGSFSPFKSQLQPLKEGKAAKVEKSATKDASQEKQGNKLSKVISPSSGYSSQDAMSPHSSSPRPKKGLLAKLQRLFPLHNSAGSAPSSDKTKAGDDSVDTVNVSPSVRALRDLFNIPPPPKVHAPPPPPPEVWAHSKRSVELLLGPPVPENLYAIIKKNPKDRRQQRQSPSASTEGSLKSLVSERKQKTPGITVESANGSVRVLETKMVQESRMMKSEMSKENNERLAQNVNLKGNIQTTEKDKVSDKLNGMLMKAAEKREEKFIAMRDHAKKTSTQATDALHISPSPSPKQSAGQTVASPETSWPPPPPPSVPQVGIGGPEEVDFPLPPPPLFGAVGLVIPERSSSSQETAQPTLTIPPPPPYSAPPPPLKEPSPSTTEKIFLPSKDAFPPPPEAFAPSPFTKVLPPPPKEFAPTPDTVASPPPPPPPAAEVPPPVSAVVSPPPPPASTVVSPPPPPASIVVSPPPPPASTVVSPPPPPPPPASIVVSPSPPPPAAEVPPPASTVVSPPPPPSSTVVSPPPAQFAAEVPPPASTVVSPPPPPSSTAVPPPVSTVVASARPKESPLQVQEVKDVSHTSVKVASPSTIQEVSPLPPEEISTESSVDSALVGMLTPPSSIPPPPPLPSQRQSSDKDVAIPQETTQSKPETSPVSCNSILTPPQSIPPPPSIELLHQPQIVPRNTNSAATQEDPPSKVSVQPAPEISPLSEKAQEPVSPPPPPLPPSLPVQSLATITHQPSSANTENQNQELTSVTNTAQKEEPVPIVTPSLLQMVKLRSVNSSPEPPKAPDLPQPEVTRKEVPSIEVPTSSANGETPQKPIRKSLIITSASPPVIIEPQSALPKSQSLVVPTASSSTALSPTKKSPTTTGVPSMNLQEVIRMRTASKSRESPASRLSVNSPTSPIDPLHSPSSTASFIFSKSYKKMVIETKPASQAKAAAQNNQEAPKVVSEAESLKAGVKVPPPVAKKPKTKGRENETSEETEQTAGQEGEQEDAAEKRNGTAGTVEGGGTAST